MDNAPRAELQQLVHRGVRFVVAWFDGQGDSGDIDTIRLFRAEDPADDLDRFGEWIPEREWEYEERDREELEQSSQEHGMLRVWIFELLEQHAPGWEISADEYNGSFGSVVIDLAAGTYQIHRELRIETLEPSGASGTFEVGTASLVDKLKQHGIGE